jgi:hypothetical protein
MARTAKFRWENLYPDQQPGRTWRGHQHSRPCAAVDAAALACDHRPQDVCEGFLGRGIDRPSSRWYSTYISDASPGTGNAEPQGEARTLAGHGRTGRRLSGRVPCGRGGCGDARKRTNVAKLIERMPTAFRGCRHLSLLGERAKGQGQRASRADSAAWLAPCPLPLLPASELRLPALDEGAHGLAGVVRGEADADQREFAA